MKTKNVVVRFPPSPTGPFHIGSARTALFNFLFARHHNGKFLLRIEDTDKERSKKEFEQNIFDSLEWLGLKPDNNEVIHQSQRLETYKKYLEQLLKADKAYISSETEGENREVVRFKNPNLDITFQDLIRGEITFNTEELGDFIIARNINDPLYHLAVVVDDLESGVTHVIRGEDGISNTSRQILILEALGGARPIYAHLPLVLATDRSKLSKRKHGEMVSLNYYQQQGYLPEAILNYIALLGWHPNDEREIFTLKELIEQFSLARVQKGGAIFDEVKLRWVNKEHLKLLTSAEINQKIIEQLKSTKLANEPKLTDQIFLERLLPLIQERIEVWGDVKKIVESGELDYYFKASDYEVEKLVWKGTDLNKIKAHLNFAQNALGALASEDFQNAKIKLAIWDYAEKWGRGEVLWPLRFALSGRDKSPDPFTLADILGQKETLSRLKTALDKLA